MSRRRVVVAGVAIGCVVLWYVFGGERRGAVSFDVEPGSPALTAEILDRRDVALLPPVALPRHKVSLREGWMKVRLSSPGRLSETAYFYVKGGHELRYVVGLRGQVIDCVEGAPPAVSREEDHAPVVADVDGDGQPEIVSLDWPLAVVVRDAKTQDLRWREYLVRYPWTVAQPPVRLLLGPEMRPYGGRTLIAVSIVEETTWWTSTRYLYYDVLRGSDGLRMVTRRHRLADDGRTSVAPLRWGPRGADGWPTLLVSRSGDDGLSDVWQLHVTSGRIATSLKDGVGVEVTGRDGVAEWAVWQPTGLDGRAKLTRLRGDWPVTRRWLKPVGVTLDLSELPAAENPVPLITESANDVVERRMVKHDDETTATSFVPHPMGVDRRVRRPWPWCPVVWAWWAIAVRATGVGLVLAVVGRWLARRWWRVGVGVVVASVLVGVVLLVEDGMEYGERYAREGWWFVGVLGAYAVGVALAVNPRNVKKDRKSL